MGTINLNDLKKEFVELGVELGLIEKEKVSDVQYRLDRIKIEELDPNPVADAMTREYEDKYTICINPDACKDESYRDEIVFSELAHLVNDIHLDIHVYHKSDLDNFFTEYKDLKKGNLLLDWPLFGAYLLDECISEYISLMMISKKYGAEFTNKRFMPNTVLSKRRFKRDDSSDYEKKLSLANYFSKALYSGNDSMKKMCKDALSDAFIDRMFAKFNYRKNGPETLYELFGFMGSFNTVLMTIKGQAWGPVQITKGHIDENGKSCVPYDNAELAKKLLFERVDKVLQEN